MSSSRAQTSTIPTTIRWSSKVKSGSVKGSVSFPPSLGRKAMTWPAPATSLWLGLQGCKTHLIMRPSMRHPTGNLFEPWPLHSCGNCRLAKGSLGQTAVGLWTMSSADGKSMASTPGVVGFPSQSTKARTSMVPMDTLASVQTRPELHP